MPALSSDVLERQFGPTEVEILRQDDKTRVIATKVVATGQVLELSKVSFRGPGASRFQAAHLEAAAGKSMGKAFADLGIPFKRQLRAAGEYDQSELPRGFTERFGYEGAATVIDVSILVGPDYVPYADILEVYSPAVSWQPDANDASEGLARRLHIFGELLTNIGG